MKSHRQSSDTTSTSSGELADSSGLGGSRSCELIQAIPPRNEITSAGMDQMINSILPEYSQLGRYMARRLPARNHQANTSVRMMTGTMTASMMAVASPRMRRSARPTGPWGSSGPSAHDASVKQHDRRQSVRDGVRGGASS